MLSPARRTVAKCLSSITLLGLLLWGGKPIQTAQAEATGWRGDGSGVFASAQPPRSWSTDSNVAWKTAMPGRSISSPAVIGGKVFTLAQPTALLCLDAASGEILWQREHDYVSVLGETEGSKVEADLAEAKKLREQLDMLRKEFETAKNNAGPEVAKTKFEPQLKALEQQIEELTAYPPIPDGTPGNTASTPVTDGKTVWAVFGTGIVSAHDMAGNRLWAKFVANPRNRHSASPLVLGDLLIVDLKGLIALDAKTGEKVWEAKTHSRAGTVMAGKVGGMEILVTPGGDVVSAADGTILAQQLFQLGYCSPLVHDDVVYAVEKGTVKAVQLLVQDGQLRHKTLWEKSAAQDDRLGSPVILDGLLYTVTGKGIIEVYEAATGETVYKQRLPISRGRLDPSLAIADGLIFISTNRGHTLLVQPGREFKSLGQNELEEFSSSPVFSGRHLFIRTEENLYCLGE